MLERILCSNIENLKMQKSIHVHKIQSCLMLLTEQLGRVQL